MSGKTEAELTGALHAAKAHHGAAKETVNQTAAAVVTARLLLHTLQLEIKGVLPNRTVVNIASTVTQGVQYDRRNGNPTPFYVTGFTRGGFLALARVNSDGQPSKGPNGVHYDVEPKHLTKQEN